MKKCKQCGAEMNDNVLFCTKCGTKMEEQQVNMDSNQQSQNTYANQQSQNTYANHQNTNAYAGQQMGYTNAGYQQYTMPVNPYDHTAEFDPKDISDNKVCAMLVYLMGAIGIIIALLASNTSKYTAFHVRQALKFQVLTILVGLVTILLCWTIIVPVAAGIFSIALWVCKIIAFFSICKGKACEPYIVRNFNFLR